MSALDDYTRALGESDPLLALASSFLAPEERTRWLALIALNRELRQVALGISEPSVVGVKLGWWGDELKRWQQGRALHPLTQALKTVVLPVSAIDRWLDALHAISHTLSYPDEAALRTAMAPLGAIERELFGHAPSAEFDAALGVLNALQDARSALKAERVMLPLAALAAAGLQRGELIDPVKQRLTWPIIAQQARALHTQLRTISTSRLGAQHLSFVRLRALQLARTPAAVFSDGAPPLPLRAPFLCWFSAVRWA